ncbi:hypothetical protein PAECIP111893_01979 [Paenibacillus plantiphilus]|uniref:Uncharacterized protein n=1 Tax=Paenibacillus plantiphilus TaxID=2905650 RepID=A0ABM9C6R4_9BACL|nr:hypothetical protein PAECIP111893_01979 [Paenibacillus plantiphilus]
MWFWKIFVSRGLLKVYKLSIGWLRMDCLGKQQIYGKAYKLAAANYY